MSTSHCAANDVGITKFYVAYHDPALLAGVEAPVDARRVNLSLLPVYADPGLAESRLLLAMALDPSAWIPPTGYVALFHASYNTKFKDIPALHELPAFLSGRLDPHTVVCPVTCSNYAAQADAHHCGMGAVLQRIARQVNLPHRDAPGPVTNSFIAHSDVWRRLLPDWLRMYVAASDQLKTPHYDTRNCRPGLAPAYLAERFTTMWFSSQPNLKCMTIVNSAGAYYSAVGGQAQDATYAGDVVEINDVTVNPSNSTPVYT